MKRFLFASAIVLAIAGAVAAGFGAGWSRPGWTPPWLADRLGGRPAGPADPGDDRPPPGPVAVVEPAAAGEEDGSSRPLPAGRLAGPEVARRARRVIEAQYQDAVRREIDNLATAYVDALNARETVRSIRASLEVLDGVLRSLREQLRRGDVPLSMVDDAIVQRDGAAVALGQAESVERQARQVLAVLLAIPPAEADRLQVRGTIRDTAPMPPPVEELIRIALAERPDLAAYRLGVGRASADVRLAEANRFEDVFVLYTPYGYQSNNFDRNVGSSTAWSLGVLASVPLVNRNQGNIARARGNVVQTKIELSGLERQVIGEVQRAATEYGADAAPPSAASRRASCRGPGGRATTGTSCSPRARRASSPT